MIKREYGGTEHNLTLSNPDGKWVVTLTQEIGSWDLEGVEIPEHYNVDTMIFSEEEPATKVFEYFIIDLNLREIL